jgi:hypothetical protein
MKYSNLLFCCYKKETSNKSPIKWSDTVPFTVPITGGYVIKVYDGDTITVASKLPFDNSPIYRFSIRLAGIDTPEIKPRKDIPNRDLHIAKAKEAIKRHGEDVKNEYIEEGIAGLETNRLKVTLKKLQTNLVEATIRANSLKNKELAEKVINEITARVNSVEYYKQGKVVN